MLNSSRRVSVARAWTPCDEAIQHCLEYFGIQHADLELERTTKSIAQLDGVIPEPAPGVAYTLVDFDGQVGVVVDVPLGVYKIVLLCTWTADSTLNVAAVSGITPVREYTMFIGW